MAAGQATIDGLLQRRAEGDRLARDPGSCSVSDESVRAVLRSHAPLVLVEAPAGCGKTHQGADYAREMAAERTDCRLLILTHTHAACSMFSDRTQHAGARIEIRTIDSIIAQIASVYHMGLGLPSDIPAWVREQRNGHAKLATRVASLLKRHPMIAASLAHRYPVVICDEHQDSSGDQHSVIMSFLAQGARLRIFADPMQDIFRDARTDSASYDWNELKREAHAFEELDFPHRWTDGCPQLGKWTLGARETLSRGGRIDLKSSLPPSITVVFAENQIPQSRSYQIASQDRKPIDGFQNSQQSLLILTRYNDAARSFRGLFNRQIPLWEGHTRRGLERLVNSIERSAGDRVAIASAVVKFLGTVGKGFSKSAFGDIFIEEAEQGCTAARKKKPAKIQDLARFVVKEPDHRGAAKMLHRLAQLSESDADFAKTEIDGRKEFWDAVRLGTYPSPTMGLAEITHRRTYSRPKPPQKALSTIHKSKGLQCGGVIVMPCDGNTFPDEADARCLLYVAISRAKSALLLVVSRSNPSPLLDF
jgi:DNA helicase-2/ATP-dependent DNA helicase PcrA